MGFSERKKKKNQKSIGNISRFISIAGKKIATKSGIKFVQKKKMKHKLISGSENSTCGWDSNPQHRYLSDESLTMIIEPFQLIKRFPNHCKFLNQINTVLFTAAEMNKIELKVNCNHGISR